MMTTREVRQGSRLRILIPLVVIAVIVIAVVAFLLLRGASTSIVGYWTHSSGMNGYEFMDDGTANSFGFGNCNGWYERDGTSFTLHWDGSNCREQETWRIMDLSEHRLVVQKQSGSVEEYRR